MLSVEICISHTSATIYCILAALCNFSATAVPFEDFIGHPFGSGAGVIVINDSPTEGLPSL